MNIKQANLIASKYGELLLKKGFSILCGAKVSLLANNIQEIKKALRILMRLYFSEGDFDEIDGFWRAYFSLAYFVDDKYVKFSKEIENKLSEIDKIKKTESNSDLLRKKYNEVQDLIPEKQFLQLNKIIDFQKGQIKAELDEIKNELDHLGRIITYRNEKSKGMFCQIKLYSGERILISIAQGNVKIFKMIFRGLLPIKTIFKSSDVNQMVGIFADPENPDESLLDAIKNKVIKCKSIKELEDLVGIRGIKSDSKGNFRKRKNYKNLIPDNDDGTEFKKIFFNRDNIDMKKYNKNSQYLMFEGIKPDCVLPRLGRDGEPMKLSQKELTIECTPSLKEFAKKESRPQYLPEWFIAAYPDVVMWMLMNENILNEILESVGEGNWLDAENQYTYEVLRMILDAFIDLKGANFECSKG